MTISRWRVLGAAALSYAFGTGGVWTYGQTDGPKRGPEPARAVAEFAEVLRRHTPDRKPVKGDQLQLYMMDLNTGQTTLIADEPEPGLDCCGSPKWSHDGRRIIFDATPGTQFQLSHIKAIEVRDGVPTVRDLGRGNCPTFSPDDKRIAFMLNPNAEPGAQEGVWVMQADGSERRRVGEYGAPFWSPDGREFLVNSFSTPTAAIVINLKEVKAGGVQVPGHRIFSWPSWAGPGRLVACLGTQVEGDRIALLDVRGPGEAKIIEVLWKRGEDLDVTPLWPVYWPETGRCIFVGREPERRTLYTVQRGKSTRATRLEPRGYNDRLGGLSFSPDGRYLLFCGNRPEPPRR
jgi:dipeptidyl aminopeptidase/acylaminoacyl peptidase